MALTLFVFDSNILAHATRATNDVRFAAFNFITLFAAMRFLSSRLSPLPGRKRASRRYLILVGLALGASLSTKSSGFFTAWVLTTLFLLAALIGSDDGGRVRRVVGATRQLSFVLCLGLLVLWATYGFEFRPIARGGVFPFQWRRSGRSGARCAVTWARDIPPT